MKGLGDRQQVVGRFIIGEENGNDSGRERATKNDATKVMDLGWEGIDKIADMSMGMRKKIDFLSETEDKR